MLAAAPADLFAGIDDISPSGDSTVDDTPIEDAPADEAVDEPADAPTDTPAPTAGDEPPAAAAADDLPEGVIKTKDDKGKYKYNLDENRYKTVYGHHQLVQQLAQSIGETPTIEALNLRNEAYLAQERLFSTLESGDSAAQGQVVKYMLEEMEAAHKNGAVGVDPTVPFAESVYTTLKAVDPTTGELLHPAAFDNLRLLGARDLVGEMFALSAQQKDENLFHSARRIVAAMSGVGEKPADMPSEEYLELIRQGAEQKGLPFPTADEWRGSAKPAPRFDPKDRKIAELEARLNLTPAPDPAARFRDWDGATIQSVNEAVMTDAVKPSLASVADGWKDFPDDYARLVVNPLNMEVAKAVKADTALNQQVKDLQQRAWRATSDQVRNEIGAQIKNLIVHRAKLAADKIKGPILKFAADWLDGRSNSTHERHTGAQNRTQPKGPSAPVKQSLIPTDLTMPGGRFDRNIAVRQAAALLGAGR